MNTISNRFFIQALEDGTTLHGNLASSGSLTQAWTGSTAVPNWTDGKNQPTIYLTLLGGNSLVQPDDGYQWYYNGTGSSGDVMTQIVFSNDITEYTYTDEGGTSRTVYGYMSTNPQNVFMKTNKTVEFKEGGVTVDSKVMPALRIMTNLASSNNVDIDYITFKGQCSSSGGTIDFSCSTQIKITGITSNGKVGIINFVDGISDITEPNLKITMYGKLYDTNGGEVSCTTRWYLNDSYIGTGQNVTMPDTVTYANAIQVSESDVVDHATVKCEFITGQNAEQNTEYVGYAAIDDMQDPEFMYIQTGGGNGNASSLHKGQDAEFEIWVGRRDNQSVLVDDENNPVYNTIKVKLLDGNGNVIAWTSGGVDPLAGSGIPSLIDAGLTHLEPDDSDYGYRPLPVVSGKGSITIPYATVVLQGKNMTGIIKAQ